MQRMTSHEAVSRNRDANGGVLRRQCCLTYVGIGGPVSVLSILRQGTWIRGRIAPRVASFSLL
jgi:hypothetical protein